MTWHPVEKSKLTIRLSDIMLLLLALVILSGLYIFQRVNFLAMISENESFHPYTYFIFNKTFRLIGNDVACMMMIYVFFRERKYLQISFYFFLLELLVILPLYFWIKLSVEGDSEISSPLLSQVHRIIVNPILMILLMIAFWYQRMQANKSVVK